MNPLEVLGIVSTGCSLVFVVFKGVILSVKRYDTLIKEVRTNGEATKTLAGQVRGMENRLGDIGDNLVEKVEKAANGVDH